jgi:16S rRNA (uracil1498-N3)-methyltransferase
MDFIVQKATELGVTRIVPLWAERTTSRSEASEARLNRWRRIAKESGEQCGRALLPPIEPPQTLLSFLDQEAPGMKILFWEKESERRLRDFLRDNPGASSYILLVGGEGGFAAQEVEKAKSRGFVTVSLGKRILRCESMALIALALVQYERGDLG